MAIQQFTIAIDSAIVPRILAALGSTNPNDGTRTTAKPADVQQAIKDFLKEQVRAYETQTAAAATSTNIVQEVW